MPLHELVARGELDELEASIRALERAPARRKREGVFYTPSWVVEHLVDETLGRRLGELRAELGLHQGHDEPAALARHAARLDALRVLDPACGAGVFLSAALQRIARERCWLAGERARVEPGAPAPDAEAAMRATLAHNLHGLDVDAASIELAKLVLWVSAGRPALPCAGLDRNIRVGDALRGESIDEGQFDCVVGNPPYVKYQRLRKADSRVVDVLRARYASAARGNFDLYLPFIEQGLRCLGPGGRMGYIAPSVWVKQAHGEALRRIVRAGQSLERWLDFGVLQVFADATTYTALQFFTRQPAPAIDVRVAQGPELAALDWDRDKHEIPFASLPARGAWNLLGADEGRLLAALAAAGTPLSEHVESISVGVQTSADDLYHLHELEPGRYESKGGGVVELEPALVRPLVSGTDVRRWQRPRTTRRILFPYQSSERGVELVSADSLRREYPAAWAYLRTHEPRLRGREGGKFDDERWYRFGRNQNVDKQHLAKVLVPRLVRHLAATPDLDGAFVADNVDVGTLITSTHAQAWFLLAILNSTIADWWFRHTSKPFRGDYRSANRQYLAPLPIPFATADQRAALVSESRRVHELHEQLAVQGSGAVAVEAAERALDERVADLYGLDAESRERMRSG